MVEYYPYLVSFGVCASASGIGLFVARFLKPSNKDLKLYLALWVLFSFVSFLIALLVDSTGIDLGYFDEFVIGIAYSYFMVDARFLDRPNGR